MRLRYLLLLTLILALTWLAASAQDSTNIADSTKAATDSAKTDTTRADTAKAQPASKDTSKADTTKSDTTKAEVAKQDTATADTTTADTTQHQGPAFFDSLKAEAERRRNRTAQEEGEQPRQSPLVDSMRAAAARRDSLEADSAAQAGADTTAAVADTMPVPGDSLIDTLVQPEPPAHEFVGAKKCKICHKDEFTSWMVTAHARTMERLDVQEQLDQNCLPCHTTGTTAANVLLEGVQCEACHGAGNDYRKTKIMKDKDLAKENGLIEPDEKVCQRCHNEDSPTFKGFDYETAVQKLEEIHIMKSLDRDKDKDKKKDQDKEEKKPEEPVEEKAGE